MVRRAIAGIVLFSATLGIAASVWAADVQPAARWTFDETSGATAADAVGTLDGAIHGATPITDGFDAGAFRFDGADDVTIPTDARLRAGEMALSLWVRANPDASPTPGQVIVDNGNVLCGGNGYALVATSSGARVVFRDAKAGVGIVTIQASAQLVLPDVWDGRWHHVAIGAFAGEWGSVYLYTDGRIVAWAGGGDDSSHGIDYGAVPTAPLVIGRDDGSCGPAFVGDLDDVRVFDHAESHDVLAELEPPIETSLQIDSVGPAKVNTGGLDWAGIDVTLQPTPALPGTFWIYVTGDDGIERPSQRNDLDLWEVTSDGHYHLAFLTDYGGSSTVRVAFTPEAPGLPSEDSQAVEIAKAESATYVIFDPVVLSGDRINIGVSIHPSARVAATGSVELWDVTGSPTLLGAADLFSTPGEWNGSAVFDLPARPVGDYKFVAKYLGSASNLPSQSIPTTLTIQPALETGPVVINGGAAMTDDPIVEVSAPATGAIAWLITTDPSDIRRQFDLPYAGTFTTWLTAPWYGDDADGVRTIWVKWADAKNHWSDWSTDTIVLARPPAGTALIDGGAGYTTDKHVSVSVPIADASNVETVQLSNDGSSWTSFAYHSSVSWTLSDGAGTKTVRARWVMQSGEASRSVSDTIVVDGTKPTATAPVGAYPQGSVASRGAVPVRLAWTGADATSGIGRYELARSKDGSAFTTVATSLRSPASVRFLEPGHSYRFRVRPVDKAGNVGAWAYGSTFHLSAAQEGNGAISFAGGWRFSPDQAAWGGRTRYATAPGAVARITVTSRTFAWIGPVGPGRGMARVYVDGKLVATINLNATSSSERQVLFSQRWSSMKSRTIKISVIGTAGHPRVDVDAFVWGT